jgi:hypothetical protein
MKVPSLWFAVYEILRTLFAPESKPPDQHPLPLAMTAKSTATKEPLFCPYTQGSSHGLESAFQSVPVAAGAAEMPGE